MTNDEKVVDEIINELSKMILMYINKPKVNKKQ